MFSKGRAVRRWIAVVLAVAMVCGMVPWSTVEAQAAAQDVSVVQPETMYPEGITVNLYDYWLTSQDAADDRYISSYDNAGINEDHVLKFSQGNLKGINKWTKSARPHTGIVQSTLGNDGFPKLAYSSPLDHLSDSNLSQGESLAYLFDGSSSSSGGKQAYMNVGGLLQQDDQGYYYYDCRDNFDSFDKESNLFQLYSQPAVTDTKQVLGQFFPFNTADEVFGDKKITCNNAVINHYFGASMITRFQQPEDGLSPESTESDPVPVTYSFTGDDDVWIFIDDVLVADLGGIHDATSVEIDFHTGAVHVFEDTNNNGVFDEGSEYDFNYGMQTLKNTFQYAGKLGDASDWKGNTFADNTYHTMKFFYLERGNSASNMRMKFNLDTVLESQIEKTDQDGTPVAGATYALYEADANYQLTSSTPIATGTTDDRGLFTFYDDSDMVLLLSDLSEDHYVLRETTVPPGYRSSGDIQLDIQKLRDGTKVLLSANAWDTGAYAMPTVRVEIQRALGETSSHQVTDYNNQVYNADNGIVFAAVMSGDNIKYDNASISDDHIVYGDPVSGWQISQATGTAGVAEAAKAMSQASQGESVAGLYAFKLNGINQYYTDIDNLPGNITEYAVENNTSARFTLGYFYAPVKSLSDVTADNVVPLQAASFNHEFAMRLFAPNIQNHLLVQKVDQDTKGARDGAQFALYDAADVTVHDDGSYTIAAGAQPAYAPQTTGDYEIQEGTQVPGTLAFTSLEQGRYYLVETTPPDGYNVNPTAVEVVVDNTGVHANAGTDDDNVSVHLGLGKIVKSMIQFALDDGINATLSKVTGTLKTSQTADYDAIDWDQASTGDAIDYAYEKAAGVLEYGPASGKGPITLDYDSGWGLLDVTQTAAKQSTTANGSVVQNLGDQSLNNLFSGTTMVVVGDRLKDPGDLIITKTVAEGLAGDSDKAFDVTLTLGAGGLRNGKVINDETGEEVTFENNVATLSLKDGEAIRLSVPDGVTLTVAETAAAGFDTTYQVNDGEASETAPTVTMAKDTPQTIAITNTRQSGSYVTLDGSTYLTVIKQVDTSQVDNGSWPDDATFQFQIEGQDGAPMPATDTITIAKNGDGSNENSGAFGDIAFAEPGTYTYTIREVAGDRSDMDYDSHQATVTVTVAADENGTLSISDVSVSGDNDTTGDAARTFVNTLKGSETPDEPVIDPDGPDDLDTVNHFYYIVGYPEDYRTGEQSDDESLWPVKPQGNITRAEVATMFYRLLKKDVREANTTAENAFSDVSADDWYNVPVSSLAKMGLISGYEDGTFQPNAAITRAEFAAIATRSFDDENVTYPDDLFSDITGSEWYANAIARAVAHDLVGGYPDGTMQPKATITRAESCAIVNRVLDRRPDANDLQPLDDMRNWPDNQPGAWYYADMQEATNGHDYEWIDQDGNRVEQWTEVLPGYNWEQQ